MPHTADNLRDVVKEKRKIEAEFEVHVKSNACSTLIVYLIHLSEVYI